jgi:glycosyltransferase involved in cell wall biosynthesis
VVKNSIVMTVSDREPVLLMNTLRWLTMCDLADTEIVIVNDCSQDVSWLTEPILAECSARRVDMEPYDCMRVEGNYNNPAKAFNRCLSEAQGERLIILSSDVLVPPRVLEQARKYDPTEVVFCPMVVDLATAQEYCGPRRVFPMPWFLSCSRQHAVECGGWDENYLNGLCWEDNDFVGRLALRTGQILYDFNQVVWHQSHHQPAYVRSDVALALNKINRQYTEAKWKALPFGESDKIAFEQVRKRHETGHLMFEYRDCREVYQSAVAQTNSPFVTVPA